MHFEITSFLACGALIAAGPDSVIVGYGKRRWMDRPSFSGPSFYFPTFFLTDAHPWFEHEFSCEMPVAELIARLEGAAVSKVSPKFDWKLTLRDTYDNAIIELKALFDKGTLKKAVPYIDMRVEQPLTHEQLTVSLLAALVYCEKHPAYPYGFWDGNQGMLGATPEKLFSLSSHSILETMACGGTCRRGAGELQIMHDPKEMHEHDLIVRGIVESISSLGVVKIGERHVCPFGKLSHLVTPITLQLSGSPSFEDLVHALHPTPALGAYPKEAGGKWLMNYAHTIVPRGRYGAPAGFVEGNRGVCLVAIRNMQWDKNAIVLCAGGGIVADSNLDKEWDEVNLKLKSIQEILAL